MEPVSAITEDTPSVNNTNTVDQNTFHHGCEVPAATVYMNNQTVFEVQNKVFTPHNSTGAMEYYVIDQVSSHVPHFAQSVLMKVPNKETSHSGLVESSNGEAAQYGLVTSPRGQSVQSGLVESPKEDAIQYGLVGRSKGETTRFAQVESSKGEATQYGLDMASPIREPTPYGLVVGSKGLTTQYGLAEIPKGQAAQYGPLEVERSKGEAIQSALTESTKGEATQYGEVQVTIPTSNVDEVEYTENNSKIQLCSNDFKQHCSKSEELWCHDCGSSLGGVCRKHGVLTVIQDSHVPTYSRLTLPSVLAIQEVQKNASIEGVFARRYIKGRTQFGPLQAPLFPDKDKQTPQVYCLKNFNNDNEICDYALDDESICNWMRFVRPADSPDEQNLVVYLYNEQVYFATIKAIEYGKELKVWYSRDYAEAFGLSPKMISSPTTMMSSPTNNMSPQETMDTEKYDINKGSDLKEEIHKVGEIDSDFVQQSETESESISDGGTYCGICDNHFSSKHHHTCRPKRHKRKMVPGSKKRKGKPRKLPLQMKKEVKSEVIYEPKAKRPREGSTKEEDMIYEDEKEERKKYKRTPRYSCSYCSAKFTSQDPFRTHEATHTGKSAYTCDHPGCARGFETKFTHWRHMLSHNKPRNRRCPYCDRGFNRLDHMKTHLKTHDQQRLSFLCEMCGKSYLHKNAYDYHMALHDAKEGDSLVCKICSVEYHNKDELIKHTLTHNRYKSIIDCPKTYECSECRKMFSTNKDVKRHMVTHTKDKRFLCELCPQTFGRKDHLRRHYKTTHSHDDAGDYQSKELSLNFLCTICPQKFAKKKNLTNHIKREHQTEKQVSLPSVEDTSGINDVTALTSSPYNLYALSAPQGNSSVALATVSVQAAKSLERYSNPVPSTVQHRIPDSTSVYVAGQTILPVSVIQDQLPDQVQAIKERTVFQLEQMPQSQRQQAQVTVPWPYSVLEERDDHSYSTVTSFATSPKGGNFRPGVTEGEIARILHSQNNLPVQYTSGTPNMTVAWEAMSDYFAVPCSSVEVVTTSDIQ